jgi:polyvinyl alcohol dehydrogenase (cytochrome)
MWFPTLFHTARRGRPLSAALRLETLESRDCPSAGGDWAMYNHDPLGSRDNTAEHTLSPANVGQMGLAWSYPTAAPVSGTPAVVDGTVYAGDLAGNFYAVDADNGTLVWQAHVAAAVSDSPLVTGHTVIFGDLAGNIYGLDTRTGATKWTTHPSPAQNLTAIWGSATQIGKHVAIGVASNEEQGVPPTYNYTDNGSVVLLDPDSGTILWQTFTIPASAYAAGWRGASVWSSPTYDRDSNLLYVSTGNYFQAGSGADPGSEDAVFALDATTGNVVWHTQLVKGDIWNGNIVPSAANPDADVADSPRIFHLADGTRVVSAGSKDGFYFVMNAATGASVNGPDGLQLEVEGVLGGLYANGAVDDRAGVVFLNGNDWPNPFGAPGTGDLYAVSPDGKTLLWDFKTAAPDGSGVAIANGVVYFQSLDGNLYALDEHATSAATALLARIQTGDTYSGPAIAHGHVYEGTGNSLGYFFGIPHLTGSIVSLGLPPEAVQDLPADVAALGGALVTAELGAAAGPQSNGQISLEVDAIAGSAGAVVGDLAAILDVSTPSLSSLRQDLMAYFTALSDNDSAGAGSALALVKTDLGGIAAALLTPAVNQQQLTSDRSGVLASLDTLLTDEQAHDLSATLHDAQGELTSLAALANDVLAGRYGSGV